MTTPEVELIYKVVDRSYTEGHTPTMFVEHVHYVKGMMGGVSFGWVECLQPENLPDSVAFLREPQARDLGYHRYERSAEWEYHAQDCIVTGGECFGDGTSLGANALLDEWQEVGRDDAWLRARLGREYNMRFYPDEDEAPEMTFGEVVTKVFGVTE